MKHKGFIGSTFPLNHHLAAESIETVDGAVPAVSSTPRDLPLNRQLTVDSAESIKTVDRAPSAVVSPLDDDTVEYCFLSEGVLGKKTQAKKGHANKQEWKRNKAKHNRMSGKSYTGVHGNI